MQHAHADAWSVQDAVDYFDEGRATTSMVYPSEWFFLEKCLIEGISVLDFGCAQGGFCTVLQEHLQYFSYTGIDISQEMIIRAQAKHPNQQFIHVLENDFSVLASQQFDLVLCLGILHLHETWRETLRAGWQHTKGTYLFDLRETHLPTIEDQNQSSFMVNYTEKKTNDAFRRLPYNIINHAEALGYVNETCSEVKQISHYGYYHPVSPQAQTPLPKVLTNVYCVER